MITRYTRAGLLALVALLPLHASGQPDGAPVVLTPVESVAIEERVEAVGESRAERSVTLFTHAAGRVETVNIEADEHVSAGDLLLALESESERNAVASAQVELADARKLLDRYERTIGSGAVPPTTIDSARREAELARLDLERARIDLADRELRAPFDGHTGLTDIEPGARVDENTAVTTIDDRSSLRVRFRLAERYFGDLRRGDQVEMRPWSNLRQPVAGVIRRVDSRINTDTGTFALEAEAPNPDDRLRPGMRFRVAVTLPGPQHSGIPATALQWGDDGAYVWLIREGRAERTGVNLVARDGDRVLVDGPLEPGDKVVSEGAQRMRPGLEVRRIDAADLDNYPPVNAVSAADPR
ncbi:efflux RND transporter periplasmic adaptor subunit [Spiribacter onubensis]|uniref:Efflux RND transporter periplasmic adaptor subunit n=1 Tax=Spiribacter onubensis TaxID=3122420 RepID=A0ABV3S828_9GAMM